jgi:molecular chaperone DnaK
LTEPKLSYAEFNEAMKAFLKSTSISSIQNQNVEDEFATIFSPIQTALKKASLTKDEIDYVLFIGGSSKNPYVQAALKEHFKESDLLFREIYKHTFHAGAAIHSLVYNGFNKNIIQPITSEPFLVITKDETPKVI